MSKRLVRAIGTVTIDGEAVTQRQSALVAALALYRGRGATIDSVVDAMFGERTPPSARKSVHNQISRLRQSFGQHLIITHGDRYRLDTVTDLDLIDRASRHFNPMNTSAAEMQRLATILASWHGEPFADLVDLPLADAERARLQLVQSRLVEALAFARLMLPLGAGLDESIIELTMRTAAHPLHERAWEFLVASLYASGRRTEALSAYARFADVLDAHLGVEPSQGFRYLRNVVDVDRGLDLAACFGPGADVHNTPLLVSA